MAYKAIKPITERERMRMMHSLVYQRVHRRITEKEFQKARAKINRVPTIKRKPVSKATPTRKSDLRTLHRRMWREATGRVPIVTQSALAKAHALQTAVYSARGADVAPAKARYAKHVAQLKKTAAAVRARAKTRADAKTKRLQ